MKPKDVVTKVTKVVAPKRRTTSKPRKTEKGRTWTTEGYVYHLQWKGLTLTPKLDFSDGDSRGARPPLRRFGKMVFALPGGGELLV